MCGRYTLTKKGHDSLASRFEAKLALGAESAERAGTARFNVAPTQEVLAVVRDGEDAEREMRLLRWGLLPKWAKDRRAAYKMINAKAETLRERPAYRPFVARFRHRCLIVADGFYEWMKPEDPKQRRQPVRFTVDGGEPFAFAGLWTRAEVEAEKVASCTIVTTNANELVARVHDRMPVILDGPDSEAAWLDPATDADDAVALCVPLAPERMSSAAANPGLNKVGEADEGPELLRA